MTHAIKSPTRQTILPNLKILNTMLITEKKLKWIRCDGRKYTPLTFTVNGKNIRHIGATDQNR